ncbi:MAG: KH domain-containing protein [Pyrinomonadaceae bacterium]
MKEAVEKLVKSLVGQPDAVEVSQVDDGRAVKIEVRVAEGDMGRLIGREGRTVKAIRSLLFYAGQKHGKRYQLDLVE